jgi:hypothetical protein
VLRDRLRLPFCARNGVSAPALPNSAYAWPVAHRSGPVASHAGSVEGKIRAISGALVGIVAFAGVALALSPSEPPSTFPSEAQAQQRCPSDTVVWLNLPSGVYHITHRRSLEPDKPDIAGFLVQHFCETGARAAGHSLMSSAIL